MTFQRRSFGQTQFHLSRTVRIYMGRSPFHFLLAFSRGASLIFASDWRQILKGRFKAGSHSQPSSKVGVIGIDGKDHQKAVMLQVETPETGRVHAATEGEAPHHPRMHCHATLLARLVYRLHVFQMLKVRLARKILAPSAFCLLSWIINSLDRFLLLVCRVNTLEKGHGRCMCPSFFSTFYPFNKWVISSELELYSID